MIVSCQRASLLTTTFIRHLSDTEPLRRTGNLRSLFLVNRPSRQCSTPAMSILRTAVRRTKAIEITLAVTRVMPELAHRVLLTSIFLTWWALPVLRLSNLNNPKCKLTLCKWWCSNKQQIRWWCNSLWTQWWLRCSKLWLSAYKCNNRCSSNSLSSNPSNLLLRSPILMMLLDVSTKSWQKWMLILNQLPHSSHLTSLPQECILAWALVWVVNTTQCKWVQVLIPLPQPCRVVIRILTIIGRITKQALPIIIHLVRVPLKSHGSVTCMSLALT